MRVFPQSSAGVPPVPASQHAPRSQETISVHTANSRSASVLVGVLWCLALLSLLVIGVLHTTRMDLQIVKTHGDRIQAHYLALAGVERAKALIYQDMLERRKSEKNHTGSLYNSQEKLGENPLSRGMFRVIRRGAGDDAGGIIFGVSDEESCLNVNNASADELNRLPNMSPDIAAAIVAWRGGGQSSQDPNTDAGTAGVDGDYYTSLKPPYQPRNGPIQTIRELLMVRGVTPELLLGNDIKQNGMLDSAEEPEESASDNEKSSDSTSEDTPETGWSGLLTVDSATSNVSASGNDRTNIRTANENALTAVNGITPDIARAIVAYRNKNQNQLQTLADLLDVPAAPEEGQNQNQNNDGPKVISAELLEQIADELTTTSDYNLPGLVNINTASSQVIACLPGMTPELADAIVSYRQSSEFFENVACLLKVPGMDQQILKQVLPRITARSETFRIISEGKVTSTGVRQRIQVIVHIMPHDIKTLAYREDM